MKLPYGSYVVLPITSGALLRKNSAKFKDYGPYLTKNTPAGVEVSSQLNAVLEEVFRKFDIYMSNDMNLAEFNLFRHAVGEAQVTDEFFRDKILTNYCSVEGALTIRGFKDYVLEKNQRVGGGKVWQWLYAMGYDKDLYNVDFRNFVVTFHSKFPLEVTVKDALETSLDEVANTLLIDAQLKKNINVKGFKQVPG